MDAEPTTHGLDACANPSCSTPAEWLVTLRPAELVSEPAWLRNQGLRLCSSDLERVKAWGWAVGTDQEALRA